MVTPEATPPHSVIGWDVGGAHVKACLLERGEVIDVAQWACPLWLGLDRLVAVVEAARARWPAFDATPHAVTMTGEMVDLFVDREDGVARIATELEGLLAPRVSGAHARVAFFAGDAGWCGGSKVARQWEQVASANWFATARHAALRLGDGVLVDIGSTTTDLIAFAAGRVTESPTGRVTGVSRSDAQRLASGELVYHGVVRTPLCAFARRIPWRGRPHNVMNEFFASAADVYRLTGELNPDHDLYPSADNAAKDATATRQRLARMIGLDARDGSADEWLAFARAWRRAQVDEIAGQLQRVLAGHSVGKSASVVSAGCGDFLVADVLDAAIGDGVIGAPAVKTTSLPVVAYGRGVACVSVEAPSGQAGVQAWAQVCAPSVAVASLFDRDHR